eukprot:2425109-Pyramimonas_sp.AAC.1
MGWRGVLHASPLCTEDRLPAAQHTLQRSMIPEISTGTHMVDIARAAVAEISRGADAVCAGG